MSLTKAAPASSPDRGASRAVSRPTGAEAPHTLPRYKEPRPFVTARSMKSFSVAAIVACGGSWALYRIMSRRVDSLDDAQEAAADALSDPRPAGHSSSRPFAEARDAVPTFSAPTSFAQLAELTSSNAMAVRKKPQDGDSRSRPLLHEEASTRVKAMWNDALDALEASVVLLERQHREYREAAAAAAVKATALSLHPGSTVTLRRV
uniref:Uncharacterized protein n=1 Tax=Neobodo designis TaxID=312471 RepID=A0A7S1MQP8_NEODS|mmetsp:Transcript_45180/g.139395  ORF Transcript_45180/g.139395 Transcript_45180/m.139395 type:complete len:206 (+) Transcript_45180:31-648(+)